MYIHRGCIALIQKLKSIDFKRANTEEISGGQHCYSFKYEGFVVGGMHLNVFGCAWVFSANRTRLLFFDLFLENEGNPSWRLYCCFGSTCLFNSQDSILDIKVPLFKGPGELPDIRSYMEEFPFPFYIILRDVNALPETLSDALRQWFELVTAADNL